MKRISHFSVFHLTFFCNELFFLTLFVLFIHIKEFIPALILGLGLMGTVVLHYFAQKKNKKLKQYFNERTKDIDRAGEANVQEASDDN